MPFASLSLASVTLSNPKGAPVAAPAKKKKSIGQIMDEAGKKALRGGLPGMAAMAIQVVNCLADFLAPVGAAVGAAHLVLCCWL